MLLKSTELSLGATLFIVISSAILCIVIIIFCILLRKTGHPIIRTFRIVLAIACAGVCIAFAIKLPRAHVAKDSDITIELNKEFSLNNDYTLTPHSDIKDLEITFTYYDSSDRILATKIKNIGDVKSNSVYVISISLSEFSMSQLVKIHSCRAEVTGGKIWK